MPLGFSFRNHHNIRQRVCMQRSCESYRSHTDDVETGLLQLSASRSTTRDDRTVATPLLA